MDTSQSLVQGTGCDGGESYSLASEIGYKQQPEIIKGAGELRYVFQKVNQSYKCGSIRIDPAAVNALGSPEEAEPVSKLCALLEIRIY